MLNDSQLKKILKSVADPKRPAVPLPPDARRLGKFLLVERLAANTWRALQDGRNRAQVLRVLGNEPADKEFRALVEDLKALTQLKHPVIVSWHKLSAVEKKIHFVVRDYIDGTPLDKAAASPAVSLTVFHEIARALEHAHNFGLFHGAVHPRNIILDPGGRPYLTDFAIPRLKTHFRSDGATAYQLETAIRDVSQLGSLLWWMLAGRDLPGPMEEIPPLQPVFPTIDPLIHMMALRFMLSSPQPFTSVREVADETARILEQLPDEKGVEGRLIDKVRKAKGK